jgi:D-3-phosphoglycerate dehydrogenase
MGLIRRIPVFFRAQLQREFERRPTDDLHHRTIGIVGLGGNGRRIAQVLAPFRGQLLATDVFPAWKPPYVEKVWPADQLDQLLRVSDVVILCVPLNEQTRGMIDRHALSRMRRGSYLINVARGPVVREEDLVEALQSGRLAGAGLDVTEVEPLPKDSPLWDLPQVLITPHVGAQSADRLDVTTQLFCDNFRRYIKGERLCNLVDKQLGFPRPENRLNV